MESHLLQMRGLKQKQEEQKQDQSRSHLLQMRGLKPATGAKIIGYSRRIFYRCVD